jgi:succinate dehydrogenase / fumarate reductase, membrane anchor subunit
MTDKTSLTRVLGLSFAKNGTGHWWMQRISAVALVPLSFFVLVLFNLCFSAPYQQTLVWLTSPLNTLCVITWIVAVFYHAALGLQVVIEDYVAKENLQVLLVRGVNVVFLLLGCTALVAVFRIVSAG